MNVSYIPVTTSIPLWIVSLCLLISLVGIADHDLWTPDEPREAAIMLSMSRTGNLVIPNLAGVPFVEKPPLYYIVGAGALRLLAPFLGATTALRLTSAMWGLGALAMTGLLARRLLGREQGVLAIVLLATMPGFIHVTHWMLVDNALLFFVTAALWCFAEAYIGSRLGFLPWAAVFTGGAFLSKGFIGPLIILLGWLGLVFSWGRQAGWRGMSPPRRLGLHAVALILCLALMLSWMLALRAVGGRELWNEWFWANHVGRFSGGEPMLGHIQPLWYYLPVIAVYLLPWLVIILAGIKNLLAALCRRQMTPADRVLAAWALGGLLVLSITATKRDIYLSVLLPAFAMIGAQVLHAPMSRKLHNSLWLWAGCMLGGLLVFIVAPLLGPQVRLLTGGWGWYQVIAGLTAMGCCLFLGGVSRIRFGKGRGDLGPPAGLLRSHGHKSDASRSAPTSSPILPCFPESASGGNRIQATIATLTPNATVTGYSLFLFRHLSSVVCRPSSALLPRILAATALFYIGGLTILFPMVDRIKSYGPAFRDMADCVAADPSIRVAGATHVAGATRVAGWRLDETTRAGFYYYCDLVFPSLSDINDLKQVLARRHSRFDGILVLSRNFPPEADQPMDGSPQSESLPPWRVRKEVRMGPRRTLQLIEGAGGEKKSEIRSTKSETISKPKY